MPSIRRLSVFAVLSLTLGREVLHLREDDSRTEGYAAARSSHRKALERLGAETLVEGDPLSAPVMEGDEVSVRYRARRADGDEVLSTTRSGPLTFRVGGARIIEGLQRGVLGMRVGETRLLTIPSALAYGDAGLGTSVPPGATLAYELTLEGVVPAATVRARDAARQ